MEPLIFLFLGVVFLIPVLVFAFDKISLIQYNFKNRHNTKDILSMPSGEIIKIKKNKFHKLSEKGKIKWDNKHRYYYFDDKYSKKYKIK